MRALILGVAVLAAILPWGPAVAAAAPGPQAEITAGPDVTFKRGVRFEFAADQAGATFQCSLDGHGFHRCTSPRHLGGLSVGRHAFTVQAVGTDGTVGPPAPDHPFRVIDTDVAGHPPRASFERRQRFHLRLEGAGSAVAPHFECSLDGRPYDACRESFTTGHLGVGHHALRVRAQTAEAGRDPSPALHRFRIEPREVTFGHSVKGRPLRAYRVGEADASRTALVVGSIHGNETEGHEIAALLRSHRDIRGVELWIVTSVNPDGVARNSRGNAHGVDLNRNFGVGWSGAEPPSSGYYAGPHPFSEPESRAVRDLARRIEPSVTVWYHQPWGAVLVPCHGTASIQHTYARIAGMHTSCRGSGLPGTARRWQNERVGGRAFVVELGGGELSAGAARRNARAVAQIVSP